MSWMQVLANVYDHNIHRVGEFEERRNQRMTLLPVSHVMQNAQIEVLLTKEGEFHSAKVADKENSRIIVPATPKSANRANSSAPHVLHDKLVYTAGDYVQFTGKEKFAAHHQDYKEQLKSWVDSGGASEKVQAIYRYIVKGRLIQDLIDANILSIDADGKILEKWSANTEKEKPDIYKIVPAEVSASFVRFDVLHETPDEPVIWEDKQLFDAYAAFFESQNSMEQSTCYITGEETAVTTQHGSRIRNAGDMSKLISANDHTGFTYRGRFKEPTDAVQIGYELSQKAHHALRWLIQRQGTYVDSRYFVTFGTEFPEVPNPLGGTKELYESTGEYFEDIFVQEVEEHQQTLAQTEELVAAEMNRALQSMRYHLKEEDVKDVTVMALDAATTGRLAIVYYQSVRTDLFLNAIEKWHATCRWLQLYKNPATNKVEAFIGTPSTYRMAEAVYGAKADSRIKKDFYTRLLPCIVEQKPIPKDIVSLIFNRIKNPYSFKNTMESWEGTLYIACALISKQYESEGYTVAIQEENNTRDYLFGRLLGVAEVMERSALKARDENRATNATRYFNAFAQHPARTWMVIRKQLAPYFQRTSGSTTYYMMQIQQLEDRLTAEQMTDAPLGPVFLLGYSSQVQEFYKKKEDKEYVETNE